MKTVEIKLSEKEFKYLKSAIKSQLENWKFPINTALRYKELLKDPNISESDAKVYKNFIKIVIKKDKYFINAIEKIKNNSIILFEDEELKTLLECFKTQMSHSKNRLEDFRVDRFRWGKSNCNKLINNETEFYNVLLNIYKRWDI
jgi:hypothetical protein